MTFFGKQTNEILNGLESGKLGSGRGLNHEMRLKRAGDTHWSSHYYVMLNLIVLHTFVIVALKSIEKHHVLKREKLC